MSRGGILLVALLFVIVVIGGGAAGYLSVDHPVAAEAIQPGAQSTEQKAALAETVERPVPDAEATDDISVADTAELAAKFGAEWAICEERGASLRERIAACDRLLAGEGLTKRLRARAVSGKGAAYFDARKYGLASQAFMSAAKIDENYAAARAQLGRLALMMGKPREALMFADEALERFAGDPFTHCLKAQALQAMGKVDAAAAVLEKVPADISNDQCVLDGLGKLYTALGEPEKAIASFGKVQGDRVTQSAAQCNVGAVLRQAGREEEALAAYMKGVELNPDNECAVGHVAELIVRLKPAEEAIAFLDQNLVRHPDLVQLQCYKAAALERVDWDAARQFYDDILAKHPGELCSLRGRADLMFRQGDYDESLSAYDTLLKLDPRNASTWEGRGIVQAYAGRSEAAVADFSNALKLNPAAMTARLRRGYAYQSLGRHDVAAKDFERVLKQSPDNREAARFLAEASLAARKPEVTISACRQIATADDKDVDVRACRMLSAQALLMQSDTATAISVLEDVARTGREGVEANLHLAAIHLLQGEMPRAKEVLAAYRAAQPKDPYGVLWAALMAEAEMAKPEDIDAALAKPDIWPQPLLQHATGRIDAAAVLEAAAVPDFKLASAREAEAEFYLGLRDLLAGDDQAAARRLRRVLDIGVIKFNRNSYPALYRPSNQMEVALAAWLTEQADSSAR